MTDPAAACVGRRESQRFPCAPASSQQVRVWLRRYLAAEAVDVARIEVIELLASEVVANAVTHTQSVGLVVTVTTGDVVEVAVQDESPRSPVVRAVDLLGTGGRGLLLVQALSLDWGTRRGGAGKTVWFRVAAR